jgi:putative transposase/transposase-like zinc-binding protein
MSVLADWLVRQAPAWLDPASGGSLTPAQRRALLAITRCRTHALGGHVYQCTDCAGMDFAYHSCHHRACPRCGGNRTAAWTAEQEARLLPVEYFLVTFTVPEELRFAFKARPELLHDLLFTASAAALQSVAAIPRHLGGELGMIGVLHTWGRQLQHHPHVHYIVPGGALSADRQRWRPARAGHWLLPASAVAAAFRRGFKDALQAAAPELHAQIGDSVWRQGWWIHFAHAGSGENVVRYLARYVGKTAISDERIVHADDQSVTFKYTDSETMEPRECSLSAAEFMRRYLQHVLPPGQHRVRYFGWMHPAAKARRMLVETLLAVIIVVRPKPHTSPAWHLRCPQCHAFTLVRVGCLPRAPPACTR